MFHDHFFTYFLFELLAHSKIVIKQLGADAKNSMF